MRVYLADLGHNLLTKSSDVYPLGVANLATYAIANLKTSSRLQIELFREPQDLKSAIDREAPDVIGFSTYAWNEELAANFASYVKTTSPATLTVMGGPNWPLTEPVQAEFLRGLPQVDVYADGPTYEGERAFLNVLQRFNDTGCRIEGVFEAPIPGITRFDHRTGEFVKASKVERITELDEIPSPYLLGWMDPFLQTGYFPMMQIARGCPFSCAFCNSGVSSNSRIYAHTVENVKADLLYLAERIRPEITLCLADDNFGMYARDEEIADYIGWLQDTYRWPKYIRTTTGKNNGERIIRVMRKAKGALPMTAAVQSMNPQVLKNIKRDNIKLETYKLIQEELDRQGMQSYGELILCLPGESRATFMKAVSDLLDAGAKRISAHQLMLLHGAELGNPDQRAKFGFDTRFRVVARNIGEYGTGRVVEVEEMVVSTPDFTFQDYLDTRVFHLLLTIFYYEGNYEEAFALASEHGIKPFDLVVRLQKMLPDAPAEFREVIDDFLAESLEEIFPTRQACLDWAHANYDALVDGTKGGNLLSKYSMIGRFYATLPSFDFLERCLTTVLAERGASTPAIGTVMSYLRAVALHVPFGPAVAREVSWTTTYDVESWTRDRFTKPLAAYAFPSARTLRAATTPETRALIETKVATFGEHPSGLGKFTRTMFARDLRRSIAAVTGDRVAG
ncbi:MAG TPA: radical SAM protein [Vicinamibacterales bacterium]|nr:radical SAM protein [Vicinamibacterales bacterium]